jgi:hypothetical protein
MALNRGTIRGFEHDRMVMLFSMIDGDKEIRCVVSSSAMDGLERGVKTKPDQRDDQFLRLRDRIEHAHAFEPIQHSRICIEKINGLFLFEAKGTPAEYKAGLDLATARGYLELRESGTYVKFTQKGSDLFA